MTKKKWNSILERGNSIDGALMVGGKAQAIQEPKGSRCSKSPVGDSELSVRQQWALIGTW